MTPWSLTELWLSAYARADWAATVRIAVLVAIIAGNHRDR